MYGKPADMPLTATYEIESQLGSGGCGAVYKAWHKRLQKHIVLKELKDSPNKTPQVRRNEIEALKNIKSIYIPQVFDFLTEDGSSYTVMEYVEGESLDKLLARGEIFSEALITKWFYQLATALEALHAKGVYHRDVKPANIIRTPNGDVCLIDFNSALVSGNNTRMINRSVGYASPEQYSYFQMCHEAYVKRQTHVSTELRKSTSQIGCINWVLSDIYSLGATMHHLYTGRFPPSPEAAGVRELTVSEPVSGIAGIIERCMRTSPSERFGSAHELRYALLQNKAYKSSFSVEHNYVM